MKSFRIEICKFGSPPCSSAFARVLLGFCGRLATVLNFEVLRSRAKIGHGLAMNLRGFQMFGAALKLQQVG
jgi:hypothetical protein